MSDPVDLLILGGGPAGYTGAIRAAQLGLSVAIVEERDTLGGTCLNVGCIPSKSLLESSEHFAAAQHDFADHGIKISDVTLNLKAMMARKSGIVTELTQGLDYLMKKNKIVRHLGKGKLVSGTAIEISGAKGKKTKLEARHIMLATGSEPIALPGVPFDEERIVSSTGALSLKKVPKRLVVVGGGVIGLELGSVWSRLGAEVTVIEFMEVVGGPMDTKLAKLLQRTLTQQGLTFHLRSKVTEVKALAKSVKVTYEPREGGDATVLNPDVVLVSVGRRPRSADLNLPVAGVQTDERGFVVVDESLRTACPTISAVGDLVRGPMLAHKAEEEGVAVAERLVTGHGHVNYATVPSVIYTWPEVAWVGLTEDQARKAGHEVRVGSFPFAANGRAKTLGCTEGQIRMVADATTDRILGVHILGPRASDVLAEAVVMMEMEGSSEDLARSFHAHPTLSEALREAALAVDGRVRQS